MSFEILDGEMAGFDLGGRRQVSGVIQLKGSAGTRFIPDWPEEIRICGATYTLETIHKGAVDPQSGSQWESAIYC